MGGPESRHGAPEIIGNDPRAHRPQDPPAGRHRKSPGSRKQREGPSLAAPLLCPRVTKSPRTSAGALTGQRLGGGTKPTRAKVPPAFTLSPSSAVATPVQGALGSRGSQRGQRLCSTQQCSPWHLHAPGWGVGGAGGGRKVRGARRPHINQKSYGDGRTPHAQEQVLVELPVISQDGARLSAHLRVRRVQPCSQAHWALAAPLPTAFPHPPARRPGPGAASHHRAWTPAVSLHSLLLVKSHTRFSF